MNKKITVIYIEYAGRTGRYVVGCSGVTKIEIIPCGIEIHINDGQSLIFGSCQFKAQTKKKEKTKK